MHKKALSYKDEETHFKDDPLSGPIYDPRTLLAKHMLDEIVRKQIRQMLRSELNQVERKDSIIQSYMIEASFIPYFTVMLRRQIKRVAKEAATMINVGEVLEDLIDSQAEDMLRDIVEEVIESQNNRYR